MASFVNAQVKRQRDDYRMLASIGYSAGIIGSMGLAKDRPKFEEVFKFPVDDEDADKRSAAEIERSKLNMLYLASQINQLYSEKQGDD